MSVQLDPKVMPTPEEAIEFFAIKPDTENLPMLLVSGQEGMVVCVLDNSGAGSIAPMVRGVLSQVVEEQGPLHWVVLCAEAYARAYEKDDPTRPEHGHRPGELQERAQAGDKTVREVVMANGFSRDAEFSAQQGFRRENDGVIWEDLNVFSDEGTLAGAVPDAIRPFFRKEF